MGRVDAEGDDLGSLSISCLMRRMCMRLTDGDVVDTASGKEQSRLYFVLSTEGTYILSCPNSCRTSILDASTS